MVRDGSQRICSPATSFAVAEWSGLPVQSCNGLADQVSQVKISDASQPSDPFAFVTVLRSLGSVSPTKREETMFDLLFVGNPAIDDAIAEPEGMPQSLIA